MTRFTGVSLLVLAHGDNLLTDKLSYILIYISARVSFCGVRADTNVDYKQRRMTTNNVNY